MQIEEGVGTFVESRGISNLSMTPAVPFRILTVVLCAMILSPSASIAQSCDPYAYSLTNGTTADAVQVMSNFNTVRNCANALASGGTLTNAILSGTTTIPGSGSISGSGNISLGGTAALTFGGTNAQFKVADGSFGATDSRWLLSNGTATHAALRLVANSSSFFSIDAVQANNSGIQKVLLLNPNGGSVGIGTLSPSYTLHVNGSVAGTSAYNNLSDARLKKNVATIEDALGIIERLRGVRFDWRTPKERAVGKLFNLPINEPQVGFLAQEVNAVLPEAVTVSSDENIMSIEETKVVPVLVEAIKELKKANNTQAGETRRLRDEISELKAQFELMRESASATRVTGVLAAE